MYVFYINGSHVEKRFGREFINFICGGKIKQDIKSEESTRKRLVVKSSYAAKKLLSANGRAFWPDGTRFRCKQLKTENHRLRRRRRCHEEQLCCKSRRSSSHYRCRSKSPPEEAAGDDWYNNASFIDINFDNFNDKPYYNDDIVPNLSQQHVVE